MTISIGQIFVISLLGLVLFGNFPNIIKDIAKGIKTLTGSDNKKKQDSVSTDFKKEQEKRDSNP